MSFVIHRLATQTSLRIPPLHKFCYLEEVRNFKSHLLVTIALVLDGSWMLSGRRIITQDCTFVVGKMCHNYSSKTPFRPWAIIKSSGSVVCGHCTCKAEKSETFSDVKAVLSWSEADACVIDQTPCTSKEKGWFELIITALEGYSLLA